MTITEKITHLFSKINWGASFLDAKAVGIMNTLDDDIKDKIKEAYEKGYNDGVSETRGAIANMF